MMTATQIKTTQTAQSRLDSVDFSNLPFGKIFSDHMFVSEYRDGAWHDDRIEPFGNFTLHPASMVLHYGQAIFEGMKASKHQDGTPLLLRPEEHARRLNASARRMMMAEFPEERFVEAVRALVKLDQAWIPPQAGSALYLRPYMFATDEFIGVRPSQTYKFCIFTAPVGPYYAKPVDLVVEQHYVRAVPGGTGEAKAAGNYAASLRPAYEANQRGFDQVLWMGGPGMKQIQEVGTMNVFFVIDGEVITPATDGAILRGITRKMFVQILRDEGHTVSERVITIDEVAEAYRAGKVTEMFGAGTAAVVSHVASLTYGEEKMTFPPVAERTVGPFLKEYIDGLRVGRVADRHGWLVRV